MKVLNKTHYYSPYTRVYNEVPDVDSFATESAKRVSYQQRLFFEFEDTKRCKGQAFFYTFTYNDTALPTFMDIPCFNYNHVRLITNGIISHELKRKYGSQMRYFCACESGEGKGKRGLGNNPHYHFIFFVSPLRDKENNPIYENYKPISTHEFKNLCKRVWQYKVDSNNKVVFCDYKSAKFGHVQEGNNNGLIDCGDAFGYVAKYVTKSALDIDRDAKVVLALEKQIKDEGYTYDALYNFYLYQSFNNAHGSTRPDYKGVDSMPLYKYFLDSDSRRQFFEDSGLQKYQNFRRNRHNPVRNALSFADFCRLYAPMKPDFWKEFTRFYNFSYRPDVLKQMFSEYRNTYGNKVRCSKSLGIYGLTQIKYNGSDVQMTLNTSHQVLVQSPCLYYIRKMFYDTSVCPYTNNVLYTLNDKGVDYKVGHLQKSVQTLVDTIKSAISFALNPCNENQSDVRSLFGCHPSYRRLLSEISSRSDINDLLYKYSMFSLVYKYRHYEDALSFRLHEGCSLEDYQSDYRDFLLNVPAFGEHSLLLELSKGYHSFAYHPVFAPYKSCFDILDKCFDAYQCWNSSYHKAEFDRKGHVKKMFNKAKMNSKYLLDFSEQFGPNYATQFLTL